MLVFGVFVPFVLGIDGPHRQLFEAIKNRNIPVVTIEQYLNDHPDWINMCDDRGRLPIHAAASARRVDVLRMLIEEKGVDVNTADPNGFTPLLFALTDQDLMERCGESASKYLVSKGAIVGPIDHYDGSILHMLVDRLGNGNVGYDSLRFLYDEFSGKCDFASVFGLETVHINETPLEVAISERRFDRALALVEMGASVNRENEHGEKPLFRIMDDRVSCLSSREDK